MKKEVKFEYTVLTSKEALSLLEPHLEGRKKRVHTFEGFSGILIGCDVDLTIIKKRFKEAGKDDLALAGSSMRGIGHGVGIFDERIGWMFIESDKERVDAMHKEKGI